MKEKKINPAIKRLFMFLIASIVLPIALVAQDNNTEVEKEFVPKGKAFGKVFFNYNYNFTEDATQRNSFAIQRTYLGYKYNFSEDISVKITLDGARSSDASDFTVFLKTAQLDWKVTKPVTLSIGMIGLKQFDTQEKFWGYRYLFKSFQDEFKLGSSADLGINAEIKIIESLKANVFVLNGEGYTSAQDMNGRIKAGGNLIFTPVKGLEIKGYYDIYGGKMQIHDSISRDTVSVQTLAIFAGYKTDKFRVGAEVDYQMDGKKYNEQAADHDILGMAVYGTYVINKKFEVFAEWLKFQSNKVGNDTETWNNKQDGNIILGGLQYTPVKGVKIAANYRAFVFDDPDIKTGSYFFLNFEFAF
jgi:hypothetical protein